jgi:hypothetical protein
VLGSSKTRRANNLTADCALHCLILAEDSYYFLCMCSVCERVRAYMHSPGATRNFAPNTSCVERVPVSVSARSLRSIFFYTIRGKSWLISPSWNSACQCREKVRALFARKTVKTAFLCFCKGERLSLIQCFEADAIFYLWWKELFGYQLNFNRIWFFLILKWDSGSCNIWQYLFC